MKFCTPKRGPGFIIENIGTGSIVLKNNIDDKYYYNNDFNIQENIIRVNKNIVPQISNKISLGSKELLWKEVFIGPGTINLSTQSETGFATIGADDNGFAYTEFGFATPFINIGPSVLTPKAMLPVLCWIRHSNHTTPSPMHKP